MKAPSNMKVAIRVFFVVLLFCDFVVWLIAIIAKKQHPKSDIQQATSQQATSQQATSNKQRANKATKAVWKTVPSVARVTRDEVSGLQTGKKRLSGRQYQTHKLSPCNIIVITS